MKKFVTIKDVAKAAGVSINTVSRALNNKPDINKETKERVLRVARELGYVRDATAVSLRYGLTKVVGVIFEDSSNPFFSEVLRGIEQAARSEEFNIILMNTEREYYLEERAIQTMLSRRVDGIIICPTQEREEDVRALASTGVPTVVVGVRLSEPVLSQVYSDDEKGAYLAVNHMLKRGRRRIVFLSAYMYKSVAQMRYAGYLKALKEFGITESFVVEVEEGVENAYVKTRELLSSGPRFDGLFCFNDIAAIGALQAIREKGLRVPDDVSVVGYDDISLANFVCPRLTTIRIDKELEGRTAFGILIELIKGKSEKRSFKSVVLDVELVVRDSA